MVTTDQSSVIDIHTHKSNPNITLKKVIKSQENIRRRKGEKRPKQTTPKELAK